MTKFALCFLLVFGQLAFGGMFALAVPPFFKIERGFYKSTAAVYVVSALMTTTGLAMLAWRANPTLSAMHLWVVCAIWVVFCLFFAVYLITLWTDHIIIRARAFSLGLLAGLIAVIALVLLLKPSALGAIAALAYALTAITSALVLGLVSGAMMFGHWYLIDLGMDVEYLRSYIRLLGVALVADLLAMVLALAILGLFGGESAISDLLSNHLALLLMRLLLGPIASIVLAWMCWQTLKIPQTMAATGLLYIALMSVVVGEMLGRFILFRTALPL